MKMLKKLLRVILAVLILTVIGYFVYTGVQL